MPRRTHHRRCPVCGRPLVAKKSLYCCRGCEREAVFYYPEVLAALRDAQDTMAEMNIRLPATDTALRHALERFQPTPPRPKLPELIERAGALLDDAAEAQELDTGEALNVLHDLALLGLKVRPA